ncbi:MAG: urate hydroxylase PuuD [Candidatus Methylomirabilia bacterium]
MALVSYDGWLFLLRWVHFLAGITWIGVLYYFNFVQTPFFAETDPSVRSGAIQKLVPRALWWFRWGAMFTFLSGGILLLHRMPETGFVSTYSWAILLGSIMGTIMWANVWFVIWPAQKVVIESATRVAQGGQPIAEAAARGQRAGFASRTNTLLSIPMLFYMGAASHLANLPVPRSGALFWIICGIILAIVEGNALFGRGGPTKKLLATVSGTVWAGFILAAIFYILFEVLRS